ncbi:myosin light chain kinase, smooth muscle [Trichonephila clavipes]|nr:myosin light chain kinase, smooth muscle [Trichonephila clavipes]
MRGRLLNCYKKETHQGRVLSDEGSRLSILEGREMSVVTVNEVTADDSGKYVVSVENQGGGDSCFASVAVVGE